MPEKKEAKTQKQSKKPAKKKKPAKETKESKNPLVKLPKQYRIALYVAVVAVALGAIWVLLSPYIPRFTYWVSAPDETDLEYAVSQPGLFGQASSDSLKIPEENRLIMPSIDVDMEILEGQTLAILDQEEGVWREPDTSDPLNGGNMVISGHRFQYLPPNTNTFYHLDKTQVGDHIVVFWDQKDYIYEVTEIFDVYPDQLEIKDQTEEPMLTIYTCTPLGSTNQRLVVRAKLLQSE